MSSTEQRLATEKENLNKSGTDLDKFMRLNRQAEDWSSWMKEKSFPLSVPIKGQPCFIGEVL